MYGIVVMDHVVFSSWQNTLLLRFTLIFVCCVVRAHAWQSVDSAILLRLLPTYELGFVCRCLCHVWVGGAWIFASLGLGGLAIGAWSSLLPVPLD
jgi:hypothetical protein